MKLLSEIGKNLKLLLRNRESAYTIVFGPLLIILLVSFAFVGSSDDYTIRVGTHAEESSDISEQTIETLAEKGYLVSVYETTDECINAVKSATVHACIAFGKAESSGEAIPVTFALDPSRINLVSRIADDLSGEVETRSRMIREEIASSTLLRLSTAATLVEKDREATLEVKAKLDRSAASLDAAKEALAGLPNSSAVYQNDTDLRMLKGAINGLAQDVKFVAEEAADALDEAKRTVKQAASECIDCSEGFQTQVEEFDDTVEEAKDAIYRISEDSSEDQRFNAELLLEYAIEDYAAIRATLANATASGAVISQNTIDATTASGDAAAELGRIAGRLEYTAGFLRGEEATVETLSAPVKVTIMSVTATEDRLAFVYPYLLVLVIMFIGMLLASMLVVADKTSRAAFRSFTTPTPDRYHVAVAFLTASAILLIELFVILVLSGPLVGRPLLANPVSTLLIACVAIGLFTFLGMLIGYLSSTQEAAMIASISIGSVLLFVSNLIIPVEGLAGVVQRLSAINPYVALSELLKRSMLYGVTFAQVLRGLVWPILFGVFLLILTVWVRRRLKRRYFRQDDGILNPTRVPAPLVLGEFRIHNEIELLDALDRMTRSEFESHVKGDDNPISRWAETELRDKRLTKHLRTSSKERMMLRLDDHLKKHGKRITR